MSKMGKLAAKAVRWLKKAVGVYKKNREQIRALAQALADAGIATERIERFLAQLSAVEQTAGAHTTAWLKIHTAAQQSEPCELSAAEVKYLDLFKAAFDKHLKQPFI